MLKKQLAKIAKAEESSKQIGPCPIPNCTSHHAPIKDIEMVESGQYANTNPPESPSLSPSKLTPRTASNRSLLKNLQDPSLKNLKLRLKRLIDSKTSWILLK
ncbi:hypothetical protein AVEN_82064-1 [Araneus ventricosus]|uniref:Uncharacterized protein n=1 Tax=Araneus ventricosus TaxID=182803 RepID=A0A4Y2SQ68_ARAVE|nr:hypothetical protein AVEN_82064-1 [Araneus ventricosus]